MSEASKLATILSVDAAGYSRAAERDQSRAAAGIASLREAAAQIAAPLGGRIFSTAGDGLMLEFPSASAGVKAARALLEESRMPSANLPRLRIGVHLGEVLVAENGDLLGHGVNVAARLQQMAEPGAALASEAVRTQWRAGGDLVFTPLGRVQLDKMDEKIAVFAFGAPTAATLLSKVNQRRMSSWVLPAAACLVLIVLAAFLLAPKEPSRPVLALLPMLADGTAADNGAARNFADAFSLELHDTLSQSGGGDLSILGYATSSGLRGDVNALRTLRTDLGVSHVLEGAVKQNGEEIEASIALINARTGAQLWRERFKDRYANLYPLQMRIGKRMREALRLSQSAEAGREIDPAALRLYMSVLGANSTLPDAQGLRDRIDALARAVEIAPDFARAWHQLTFAYSAYRFAAPTDAERENARSQGWRAAQRYLELTPADPRAHYWVAEFEQDAARRTALLQEALKRGQQDSDVLSNMSAYLSGVGRTEDGFQMASRAAAIDPYADFIVSRQIWRSLHLSDLAIAENLLTNLREPVRLTEVRWFAIVMGWLAQDKPDRAQSALIVLEAASQDAPPATAAATALRLELARAAVEAATNPAARRRARAMAEQISAEIATTPPAMVFDSLVFISLVADADAAFAAWDARLMAAPPQTASLVAPDQETSQAFNAWSRTDMRKLQRDPRFFSYLARYPIFAAEPYPNEAGEMKPMLQLIAERVPDFCNEPIFPYDCRAATAKAFQ
jgi:class 3 adenylate cyclase/TolB-like protein